jgi:hypothetical protein
MSFKVFGIGLPKTGTTSLQKALAILGFKTLHSPMKFREQQRNGNHSLKNGKGKRRWGAIVNFGEWTFPQLDEEFPNAKFILTVRDFDRWLISCRTHFRKTRSVWSKTRTEIFGSPKFDQNKFEETYHRHQKEVVEYFTNKYPDNLDEKLLIINICGEDDEVVWEKLCDFLGKPKPEKSFPIRNTSKKSKRKYEKFLKKNTKN